MTTCCEHAGETAIEVRDVDVSIGGQSILESVSLKVPHGQLVALIGPNGSGKTTLLRTILGLQRPTRGVIRILGQEDRSKVLSRVGYVPQKLSLDRSFILTVREFLCLRLRSTSSWFWKSHRDIDELLEARVKELCIDSLLDQSLAALSGGQLQRVLITYSLLTNPELLLLDEPTAGVDTPGEQTFYDVIAQIQKRRHLTVMLVSHDLSMVFRQASWVYALNRTLCCEGRPETVMNAESLKQAYGLHVSPYQHQHPHVH